MMKLSAQMHNGSEIVPLHSAGGSTLQCGEGRGLLCLAALVTAPRLAKLCDRRIYHQLILSVSRITNVNGRQPNTVRHAQRVIL